MQIYSFFRNASFEFLPIRRRLEMSVKNICLLAVPPGCLAPCPEGVVPFVPAGYLPPEGFLVPFEPFIIFKYYIMNYLHIFN